MFGKAGGALVAELAVRSDVVVAAPEVFDFNIEDDSVDVGGRSYREVMFLPRHCAVCRAVGTPLCESCADRLQPPAEAPPIDGLDRCVSLFSYEGAGRAVIARLK